MFTPLVEAIALREGRPLRLLSAPINPKIGVIDSEDPYPVWRYNPFVSGLLDISTIQADALSLINAEQDNLCQFNHVIENICFQYGVRPRALRPSLFLHPEERAWALQQLREIPRPVVALHPSGTTAPRDPKSWGGKHWLELIKNFDEASFIQIGKPGPGEPELGIPKPETTIRQAFALIWACDAFIGFDSSPMHMATAFQKPVLALWDAHRKLEAEESWQRGFAPAVMLRWGYPQNRNLMILGKQDEELISVMRTWLRDTLLTLSSPYLKASSPTPSSS